MFLLVPYVSLPLSYSNFSKSLFTFFLPLFFSPSLSLFSNLISPFLFLSHSMFSSLFLNLFISITLLLSQTMFFSICFSLSPYRISLSLFSLSHSFLLLFTPHVSLYFHISLCHPLHLSFTLPLPLFYFPYSQSLFIFVTQVFTFLIVFL